MHQVCLLIHCICATTFFLCYEKISGWEILIFIMLLILFPFCLLTPHPQRWPDYCNSGPEELCGRTQQTSEVKNE